MKYWKRIDAQGNTTTVESYSFDAIIEGATNITKEEHDLFNAKNQNTPSPNIKGFYKALLAEFGLASSNALLVKYPVFARALDDQNWTAVTDSLAMAVSDGAITQLQSDHITAIGVAYNIKV